MIQRPCWALEIVDGFPDALHRANFQCSFGARGKTVSSKLIVLYLICLVPLGSCSSRFVYDPPPQSAVAQNAVNINTATADEIEKLPHIGRKTAEAIVAFREENGPFRRPEHLILIRGVSQKRFAEIRQFLRTE